VNASFSAASTKLTHSTLNIHQAAEAIMLAIMVLITVAASFVIEALWFVADEDT
jgi:hypothetical protein